MEIIHAYTVCSLSAVPLAVRLYTELLLCTDTAVSFGAKQALIRVLRPRHKRRKVFIPSPPRCSTPGKLSIPNIISLIILFYAATFILLHTSQHWGK